MLALEDVHVYYGDSHVLRGVSLEVPRGRVVALLGRNGAGKTTTLRAIVGLTPPRRGRVTLDGRDVTRLPAHRRARLGIGLVPAGRRSFGDLTVRQNLLLGAAAPRPSGHDGGRGWTLDDILAIFPKLAELLERPARFLSGGEQQMLKLGRCLLTGPRLLLLDEPSEGLAPTIVQQLRATLGRIRELGLPILLCEQNARFALGLADDAYLLEKGAFRYSGPAAEVASRPELVAHLGIGRGTDGP